jgi:CRP-like cAMP-binding protein
MPEEQTYRVGESIIQQGDEDTCFYVLEKGAVEVVKDGTVLSVLMFPGTIFGEISSILKKPRTSSVRARTATSVTCYECGDLEELVAAHPEIAIKMLQTLASRLERTTQKLSESF